MDLEDRPNSRDLVIYQALPNELPRVAGIITTVRQTPLSHVNLRAVQNGVPNCLRFATRSNNPSIAALVGRFVRYEVTDSEWTLRARHSRGGQRALRVFAAGAGPDPAAGPRSHIDHDR